MKQTVHDRAKMVVMEVNKIGRDMLLLASLNYHFYFLSPNIAWVCLKT